MCLIWELCKGIPYLQNEILKIRPPKIFLYRFSLFSYISWIRLYFFSQTGHQWVSFKEERYMKLNDISLCSTNCNITVIKLILYSQFPPFVFVSLRHLPTHIKDHFWPVCASVWSWSWDWGRILTLDCKWLNIKRLIFITDEG